MRGHILGRRAILGIPTYTYSIIPVVVARASAVNLL